MSHHQHKGHYTNRLINEKSPYLLQHAHNPVDWYPWGEAAFAKAHNEDKLIFLSIGYSTCHWCHVMERESFENEDIAELMNKHFVSVKVDREERPDVDRVYMSYVQATTGGGGWPMSVFLTPNLKPVFGGTYFPPNDGQYGVPGFPHILHRLQDLWASQRDKLLQSGNYVIEALREHEGVQVVESSAMEKLVAEVLSKGESYLQHAAKKFESDFDRKLGGFGAAPKFPRPVILNLLFRLSQDKKLSASQQQEILHSCLFTLEKMAQGGMYDQLGWGFHRYSVDAQWHVPHFEKMLFDQAQLVQSYLDGFQITKQPFFSHIATQVLDYTIRDMTYQDKNDPSCASFFGAEDADSLPSPLATEKKEGAFYVWTYDELKQELCDEETFSIFCYMYDVGKDGNVSSAQDPHGELTNQNILSQRKTVEQVASHFGIKEDKVLERINEAKNHLFNVRAKRPRPHLDDKILTNWNGMMLGAFARASRVLQNENALTYLQQARKCAQFIEKHLYDIDSGTLFHTNRDGETNRHIRGFLSDYCFLISGLIDLYEASGEVKWIQWAYQLQEKQNELFLDKKLGCTFFDTDGLDKSILLRQKENYDGAEPSGNSVSCNNLVRLGALLDKEQYNQLAINTISMFQQEISKIPHACPQLMCALDMIVRGPRKLVLVYKDNDHATQMALKAIYQVYQPNRVLVHMNGDQAQKFFSSHSPYLQDLKMVDGKPTALICMHHACQLPTTVLEEMKSLLAS